MHNRHGHDGKMDPTGSGNDNLTLPPVKKRSKFKRVAPKRFVDTERDIETNRHNVQLPPLSLNGKSIKRPDQKDDSNQIRQTASSPIQTNNHLVLPPIDPSAGSRRVPTPRPPPTPNSRQGGHRSARYNPSNEGLESPRTQSPGVARFNVIYNRSPSSQGRSSGASSRASTVVSRNANSASCSNTSQLGNTSRNSLQQGSTSARTREGAPTPSVVQPAPYQHQGSCSDGALMIKKINPIPPPGRICNTNTLRRHSTGGKMVPKHEKTNKGLFVIDEKKPLKPKSSDKSQSRLPSPPKQPSKTSVKSLRKSSNHTSKTSQVSYEPDFHPESDEEANTATNSRVSSSRAVSSEASCLLPSSKTPSRPPSSIHEEIDGRYRYSDEVFERYEEPETGRRPISEASSVPEELPGQSMPYNYQDDEEPPETDIPEEIVISDDDDDDLIRMSRC